ncbi:MAG TPA: rhodanese-like domain-containing protein [Pseudomonadota bacterium]|jgi:rhodanese-related sulfurtransferase|nr:rhodanese-like domain-containing protein [Pseudomonadota bacterium]HND09165.1 rhodanese-like domain-containing protein [Pseudomonadota bacterium]HNF99978.1 rhodanese-like domain-containing protein [Pseudomonadota bacterium]HNK44276.1 rhodanese-like domain-containing protein [Pseudomonadota bacterium]HNN51293.1 rhodanese-like domain-containing protein [Pseudomonadota bacterium]
MKISLASAAVKMPGGYLEITAADFARVSYQGRLIDVREPAEFVGELGHLPRAELVPLATILEKAAVWNREEPLVLVCRSGARSGRAAQQLVAMGFRHVVNLGGGMLGVNAAGMPTDR